MRRFAEIEMTNVRNTHDIEEKLAAYANVVSMENTRTYVRQGMSMPEVVLKILEEALELEAIFDADHKKQRLWYIKDEECYYALEPGLGQSIIRGCSSMYVRLFHTLPIL